MCIANKNHQLLSIFNRNSRRIITQAIRTGLMCFWLGIRMGPSLIFLNTELCRILTLLHIVSYVLVEWIRTILYFFIGKSGLQFRACTIGEKSERIECIRILFIKFHLGTSSKSLPVSRSWFDNKLNRRDSDLCLRKINTDCGIRPPEVFSHHRIPFIGPSGIRIWLYTDLHFLEVTIRSWGTGIIYKIVHIRTRSKIISQRNGEIMISRVIPVRMVNSAHITIEWFINIRATLKRACFTWFYRNLNIVFDTLEISGFIFSQSFLSNRYQGLKFSADLFHGDIARTFTIFRIGCNNVIMRRSHHFGCTCTCRFLFDPFRQCDSHRNICSYIECDITATGLNGKDLLGYQNSRLWSQLAYVNSFCQSIGSNFNHCLPCLFSIVSGHIHRQCTFVDSNRTPIFIRPCRPMVCIGNNSDVTGSCITFKINGRLCYLKSSRC